MKMRSPTMERYGLLSRRFLRTSTIDFHSEVWGKLEALAAANCDHSLLSMGKEMGKVCLPQ
jgi:hypothetical protein